MCETSPGREIAKSSAIASRLWTRTRGPPWWLQTRESRESFLGCEKRTVRHREPPLLEPGWLILGLMIHFLIHGRVRLVRRKDYSCIATWNGGVAHRYSLTRRRVRRVRSANSRDRRECVRRARRAGSPAAAALGRGFSRRRGTRRCPARRGEGRQKVHLDLGGTFFPLFPRYSQSAWVRQRLSTGLECMRGVARRRSSILL